MEDDIYNSNEDVYIVREDDEHPQVYYKTNCWEIYFYDDAFELLDYYNGSLFRYEPYVEDGEKDNREWVFEYIKENLPEWMEEDTIQLYSSDVLFYNETENYIYVHYHYKHYIVYIFENMFEMVEIKTGRSYGTIEIGDLTEDKRDYIKNYITNDLEDFE